MRQFFIYVLLAMMSVGAYGQTSQKVEQNQKKRNNPLDLIVMTMPDGKDSIIRNIDIFISPNKYKRQFEVEYVDSLGEVHVVKTDVLRYYRVNKKRYSRVNVLMPNGEITPMMASRKYFGANGTPSLYMVYDENKVGHLYAMLASDSLLHYVPDTNDKTTPNPLKDYLRNLNREKGGSGNDLIEEYISEMKTSRKGFLKVHNVVQHQNIKEYCRFRWGVGAGAHINTNTMLFNNRITTFQSSGKQVQATPVLFADIPLSEGISIHPELSMNKASSTYRFFEDESSNNKDEYQSVDVAYTATSINLPILLRYSFTRLKGDFVPFIEGGVQFGYNINDITYRKHIYDELGFVSGMKDSKMDGPKYNYHVLGGIGLEYRMTENHSLFLDVRYLYHPGRIEYSEILQKTNSLMISLSYNL